MPLVLDEKPEVLPPNSVDDVALYCGWYSVQNYVPGMKFNPGAVGFHVVPGGGCCAAYANLRIDPAGATMPSLGGRAGEARDDGESAEG